MKKEILIYSPIYSWTASSFINELNNNKDADLKIRVNSPGGSVTDGFGMIAKIKEHKGSIEFQIDGMAYSLGAFLPLFRNKESKAVCLDVSEFLIHRAAYPSWLEQDKNFFTDDKKESLKNMNATLRAGIESWCTAEQWESITGVSLDSVFSIEQRLDIVLTAQQAKELGLVDEITSITPEKKAEIESLSMHVASASMIYHESQKADEATKKANNFSNNKKSQIMTIEKLKSEHPDIYAKIIEAGVKQERDRVGAFMAFAHLDLETVKKAVVEGQEMTQTQMAEFVVKATSKNELNKIEQTNEGEATATAGDAGTSDEDAKVNAFKSELEANTGLKL